MKIKLVTDKKIAETSSKGNQEKWLDAENGLWYKLDQFGYEALSEVIISQLLEKSNIETDTPFTFARYEIDKVSAHKRERICCTSRNFLKEGQSIITLNKLLSSELGCPLKTALEKLSSDKKRIEFLAEQTKEFTGLDKFAEYLTLLFEIDALFLNTDRHLNNIAVIREHDKYAYCPIFDNGAGLLSDMITQRTDISPSALIDSSVSFPFGMSFTRQVSTVRRLYGKQLVIPEISENEIAELLVPLLEFYPERDRSIIYDRVVATIMLMQKKLKRFE